MWSSYYSIPDKKFYIGNGDARHDQNHTSNDQFVKSITTAVSKLPAGQGLINNFLIKNRFVP